MKSTTTKIYVVVLLLSITIGALFVLKTDADVAVGTTLQSEIHAIQRSFADLEGFISASTEDSEVHDVLSLWHIVRSAVLLLSSDSVAETPIVADKEVAQEPASQDLSVPAEIRAETIAASVQKPSVQESHADTVRPAVPKRSVAQEIAQAVHQEVNVVRGTYNAPFVTDHGAITSVALGHSIDMQNNNYFAHINLLGEKPLARFGGMSQLSIRTGCRSLYSENLAMLTTGDNYRVFIDGVWQLDSEMIAKKVVRMWMASTQGHRENMLMKTHRLSGIGVAVTTDQRYGYRIYVTQNFCS